VDFFVSKIDEFLDNKIDFRDKISKNKKDIQKFTVEKMVNKYLKLYK